MYEDFIKIGRDLFLQGVISSHGGNMSIRVGDRILITRRGSMLGNLSKEDIIETGLEENDSGIVLASTEIGVHRSIYKETSALAVVHAHPVMATVVSLIEDEIVPLDSEGSYLLHKVPVVSTEQTVGSKEVERVVPQMLKKYKIVMLRGHGSFARGELLEEAYQLTSCLENVCKIIYYSYPLKEKIKEYRKGSEEYKGW